MSVPGMSMPSLNESERFSVEPIKRNSIGEAFEALAMNIDELEAICGKMGVGIEPILLPPQLTKADDRKGDQETSIVRSRINGLTGKVAQVNAILRDLISRIDL